jgi:hypothetical protein
MNAPIRVPIRRLTESGLSLFDAYISNLRSQSSFLERSEPAVISPFDDSLAEILAPNDQIDPTKIFENRFAMAEYLVAELSQAVSRLNLRNDVGFWSWLALVYFEQLTTRLEKVRRREHYIPSIGEIWRMPGHPVAHRHSIRESFMLYESFGEESKVYFNPDSVSKMGNMIEQLRSRGDIRRNRNIHSLIVRKYARRDGALAGYAATGAAQKPDPDTGNGFDSAVRLGVLYKRLSVSYMAPLLSDIQLSEYLGPGFQTSAAG